MQLPRGTFREIKKNEKVGDILEELERDRFSGICNISYGNILITLVMKAGKSILATSDTKKGDAVLNELQAISGQNVDAALSTLNDAQIQLSLEFNKAERTTRSGQTPPIPQKPARTPAHTLHPDHGKKPVPMQKQPPHNRTAEQPPIPSPKPVNVLVRPVQSAVQKPEFQDLPVSGAKKPAPDEHEATAHGSEQASFDEDIGTIDTMDMDHVTEKIRNDCKTMVKQLHLEHLMERD
jgi:hypothetical protein